MSTADSGISFDAMPPVPDASPDETGCVDPTARQAREDLVRSTFAALTEGVAEEPTELVLPEDTTGTLGLGLNANLVPLVVDDFGTRVAASRLGEGRVVAFSGQDFQSSQERSTLLGVEPFDRLVRNSAAWAIRQEVSGEPRILADNEAIAELLRAGGLPNIDVASLGVVGGLWETRNWSEAALEGYDLIIVQVNEWGTLHVDPLHVPAIRAFVQAGGGILISGSALHWSWWLSDSADAFQGDLILAGSGIEWHANSEKDLSSTRVRLDSLSNPESLWCAYLAGDDLDTAQMARLPPMFRGALETGRLLEVQDALRRMIDETPALPAAAEDRRARLSADVASTLPPVAWPEVHPWTSTFPGRANVDEISDGNPSIDVSWSQLQPLGFYAPAGRVVTITIGAEHIESGFQIQVGERYDDLRRIGRITTWDRAPHAIRRFDIKQETTQVTNAYGGVIYLDVPGNMTGEVALQIEGAIPMAVYTRGEGASATSFSEALSGSSPLAILQEQGRIRLVVPSEEARRVSDPEAVVDFWSGFHRSHSVLAQEPNPRRYESHWIFDTQVGFGYANATPARITYPMLSVGWVLRTQTGDEDWWLFGHELGHQFQTSDWRGGDITEVAVNLFTMYTLSGYILGGGNFESESGRFTPVDHAALSSSRWGSADLFGKLQLYRQLIAEFGWERMRDTFASYYNPAYPRTSDGEFMDGFAIRFSATVERDLSSFFQRWEYPLSEDAVSRIRELGHTEWLPPGW